MSLNGRGRRRQEGAGKVDGSIRFTADLEMPGLLHVQLVLSHLPSARIRSIDTSAARSSPGVVAVVTGADLPDVEAGGPDKPLAIDRVYYA
ncbi:MAG: xanthine dehydrogenase family protein molybdopterin-binding subunit, partial [Candidatus Dormiibacterota bacterium]